MVMEMEKSSLDTTILFLYSSFTNIRKITMATMQEILNEEKIIYEQITENQLYDENGELTSTANTMLETINAQLFSKVDSYARVIKEILPTSITKLKQRKEEISSIIKEFEKRKEFLEFTLHQALQGREQQKGEYFNIKPTFSVTSEIMVEALLPEEGKYVLPPLTFEEWSALLMIMDNMLVHPKKHKLLEMIPLDVIRHIVEKATKHYSRKANVNDLEDNSKALKKHIRPTISITKVRL